MRPPRRVFMRLNAALLAVCASAIGSTSAMPAPAEVATPALAGQLVYTYAVRHPLYGKIGTFTDTIDRNPETMRIDGRLRIAVKFLGIVVYRQESTSRRSCVTIGWSRCKAPPTRKVSTSRCAARLKATSSW